MRCDGEGSGGAGGSGSKSSRLSDSFTPPTPSVIVWWTFWRNAGPASFEAFHDGELPQRTGSVEGRRRHCCRQIEQLPHPAGRRDRDGPEVVVEVEIVVGHPFGGSEAEGGRDDAVAEAWDRHDGLLDLGAHAGRRREHAREC